MPGSSARQVALLLATGAVVAGCSSDADKPQTLPTISSSPTVEASPTPTASGTADTTAAGVEAFIKSYYAEINHAIQTGDVSTLNRYSVPACTCRRLAESIRNKSIGSTIRGGAFTIRTISLHDITPASVGAMVTYEVEQAQVIKNDGTVLQTIKPESGAKDDISITRNNGGWLVTNVVLLN